MTYDIDNVVFTDDPLLTDAMVRSAQAGCAGSGVTTPERHADGAWQVRRDIFLGQSIPG